jgi:hypothetical protein
MGMRKLVGRNAARLRKEAGLTQEQLAERCGLSQQYLSKLKLHELAREWYEKLEIQIHLFPARGWLRPGPFCSRRLSRQLRPQRLQDGDDGREGGIAVLTQCLVEPDGGYFRRLGQFGHALGAGDMAEGVAHFVGVARLEDRAQIGGDRRVALRNR